MVHHLLNSVKIVAVPCVNTGSAYQVASATDGGAVVSEEIDTLGYESVVLLYKIGTGTAAAVIDFKALQCDTAGGSYADLLGTAQLVTDIAGSMLNKFISCEIHRPKERFLRVGYQRTTQNSAIDGIWAILSRPIGNTPVTQQTTIGGFANAPELFVSPAEGTA